MAVKRVKKRAYKSSRKKNMKWWNSLSPSAQKAYLAKHPNSVFGKKSLRAHAKKLGAPKGVSFENWHDAKAFSKAHRLAKRFGGHVSAGKARGVKVYTVHNKSKKKMLGIMSGTKARNQHRKWSFTKLWKNK